MIDREAKTMATELDIADRVESYAPREAFITIKDHKENFANNPKCRLINPAKSEIGLVSKKLLANIVQKVQRQTGVNQWRNTNSVIDWFKNIPQKRDCRFIQLDIADFYPSITSELLTNAINFAKQATDIDNKTINIVMHARKSLLFDSCNPWIKKNNPDFDVTMGSYDGAEICELVGLYMLNEIKTKLDNVELGLYRDDGLGITRNLSGPQTERLKKEVVKLFKSHNLKITIECNLHQVDFLDITLDLRTGKYRPYRKPNDSPLYIHKESNHPPIILKQLPTMIEERISSISCDQHEFTKVKDEYNNCLKKSGFNHDIQYTVKSPTSKPQQRKQRNIVWFNPPYNMQVETNIGKNFLTLISKHFPAHHKYHKIFNKNTIKLSYSCTPDVKSAISRHNKKILSSSEAHAESARMCNCRQPANCPMVGCCLEKSIIYKATVKTTEGDKFYIGATEQTFKKRFPKHKDSFEKKKFASATTLSKYIWEIKEKELAYSIKWDVIKRCPPYKCGTRRCDLCLSEKYYILKADPNLCLNKNSELLQKCRHSNKFKLGNIDKLCKLGLT